MCSMWRDSSKLALVILCVVCGDIVASLLRVICVVCGEIVASLLW